MPSAPSKSTTVINSLGQWLNGDAAASYLRMLAAGCPTGGISGMGAGRTHAQQERLYDLYRAGKGNLAAKPGTSLHEKGNALDLERGTPAQRWAVYGGDPYKVKSGEKLRCHAYGWRRTVSSEAWHLSYDRARDTKRAADLKARLAKLGYANLKAFQKAHGLAADGVDGPVTWAALLTNPKPAPTPTPKPKTAGIRVLIANLHDPRFGGPKDSVAQGKYIAGLNPDVILASESRPIDRDDIVAAMKSARKESWKVWPSAAGTVGLLWDAAVFAHGPKLPKDFGDQYHGAVACDLTVKAIGKKLRVISTHTRPKAVTSDAGKKRDIQLAAALKSGLTLLGGDLAKDKPGGWLTGWHRLTPESLDTMDAAGHQMPDSLWRHGSGITVDKVVLINPGSLSDHRWLLVDLTVTA